MQHQTVLCNSIKNTSGSVRRKVENRISSEIFWWRECKKESWVCLSLEGESTPFDAPFLCTLQQKSWEGILTSTSERARAHFNHSHCGGLQAQCQDMGRDSWKRLTSGHAVSHNQNGREASWWSMCTYATKNNAKNPHIHLIWQLLSG